VISDASTISPDPAANLKRVIDLIESARKAAITPASEVRLVAVSKGHAAERILPVLQAGHRHFGENRVQEAAAKWRPLRDAYPDLTLHLIGPLQTNKVGDAVALFDAIHSLDRPKLAEALKSALEKSGKAMQLFVQVNTGQEPQKAGVAPKEAIAFVRHCHNALRLPVAGLMCIPPVAEEPGLHFALLKRLAQQCALPFLSMGMSDDYETAIRFGATHVRIGTAIFGPRETTA
jgi:pyridoxal phosphate enzyme (YggS family)